MKRLVALSILLVASGCAGGGTPITGESENVGGITVTFKAEPSEVTTGQPVRLTIKLVNNTGTAEELTFPSGKLYDFWVTADGREVWRWSDGKVFTQARETVEVPGQGGETFTEPWSTDEPGSYVVHGTLTAEGFDRDYEAAVEVTA